MLGKFNVDEERPMFKYCSPCARDLQQENLWFRFRPEIRFNTFLLVAHFLKPNHQHQPFFKNESFKVARYNY